ncbi:MAG TPA: hypothetical protein VK165_02050 [Azonexus sp.]|nr:hypothetical protein [Azonexus sp.]
MTEVPVSVPIIAATIGAGAALLGTALSFGRDWFVQRLKDGQQRTFVAIRLAAELEDFATRCVLAASDHGEMQSGALGEEMHVARYSTPKLEFDYSGYEWRLIPKDLLLRTLEMPYLVSRAHAYLEGVNEFVSTPPYYEEFYSERSLKFGRIGIAALKLAQDLRVRHGATPYISSIDPDDEYDVESHLNDIVSDVLKSKSLAAEMSDC